jgi:hypothetical protein
MKYFYLYIFISFVIILCFSYYNELQSKETFTNNKNYILLGDSILNNEIYVPVGKSVNQLFNEKTNGNSLCLAVDDSKINDVYNQIIDIPDSYNTNNTIIFVSIGGNNLLSFTKENNVNTIFNSYKDLINSIRKKMPNTTIFLLDLYYPNNMNTESNFKLIKEWNDMIYDYANKNMLSVLKISKIMTEPEDYMSTIEPSIIGGEKIVNALLSVE